MLHYFFLLYIISFIFPSFSGIPKVPHSDLFLYLVIFSFFILRPIRFLKQINITILLTLLFHLIYYIFDFYNTNNNRTLIVFFIPILSVKLFWDYYNYQDTSKKTHIVKLVFFGLISTAITTIIGLSFFPEAGRLLAGSLAKEGNIELNNFYLLLGIGSYDFSFMWMIAVILLVDHIYLNYSRINNLWILLVLCLFFYGINQISITAPLLLLFLGLIIYYFSRNSISLRSLRVKIILFSLLTLQFSSYLSVPLYYASKNFGLNENVTKRFENLAKRLDGSLESTELDLDNQDKLDGEDIYVGGYEIRARKSLNSFLDNPIIGGGEVGGHNFYLDILGAFGLIGLILVLYVVFNMYNLGSSKLLTLQSKKVYEIIFILFLFLGVIKTYSLVIMFIFLFFIVPFYLLYRDLNFKKLY